MKDYFSLHMIEKMKSTLITDVLQIMLCPKYERVWREGGIIGTK